MINSIGIELFIANAVGTTDVYLYISYLCSAIDVSALRGFMAVHFFYDINFIIYIDALHSRQGH